MNASANPDSLLRKGSARRWLWCLALLPAVLPWYVFTHYHVQFPWNDAWDLAGLLVKSHQGTLQFADFWVAHNEHRILIPYLILFVMAKLTHWNTYCEVYFGYAMVCLLSLLFVVLLKTTTRRPQAWQWFVINLMIFNPMQFENWGFGFAACPNFLPIPFIVGAILLMYRNGLTWTTLLVCGLFIELASLSLANGLLGWILLLPLIVQAARPRKWFILAWLSMTAVSLVIQFWGYQPHSWDDHYYTATITQRLGYFFVFLGNPLHFGTTGSFITSIAIGIVLFAVYALVVIWTALRWVSHDEQFVRFALPWLAVGGYAVAGGILAACGRAGLGLEQAESGRYTTISMCLIICLVGMLPSWTYRAALLIPTVVTLLICALGLSAWRTRELCRQARIITHGGLAHLTFVDVLLEPNGAFYIGSLTDVRQRANILDELGYLHPPLFHSNDIRKLIVPNAQGQAAGYVEKAQQMVDGNAQVWGYAVLTAARRPADAVLITYDDEHNVPRLCAIGDCGFDSDQIPALYGPEYAGAGWKAQFPMSRMPANPTIRCWAFDAEKQLAYPLSNKPPNEKGAGR